MLHSIYPNDRFQIDVQLRFFIETSEWWSRQRALNPVSALAEIDNNFLCSNRKFHGYHTIWNGWYIVLFFYTSREQIPKNWQIPTIIKKPHNWLPWKMNWSKVTKVAGKILVEILERELQLLLYFIGHHPPVGIWIFNYESRYTIFLSNK